MNVYFLKVKKEKRDWDTESVFSGCLKIFIKYLQQFYRIFTFIPHNGFLITASVGRILVSDKTFSIPAIAIHRSNAQNVGFENPTYV